ncbi:negative elongation factor E [Lepeophtheirus salmonis]|uniref:Negative elongation factor E CG5994PAlike [Tribolium castaneum] n=1 Tax=Lepeophtheirus salmonis TaxID=72036 RepID=A0A0K2UI83_LEPSM|nr:negative elongation factor E-like [Lepeophtheirus salmonis]
MGYLQFSSNLSEEERFLQAKYAKLRKKKKEVAALKTPKPIESEKISSKKIIEAVDAKEVAKRLSKTGALLAIQKSVEKTDKSRGFKRSQGWERKLADSRTLSAYQPFSATHGPGGGFDTGVDDLNPEPPLHNSSSKVSHHKHQRSKSDKRSSNVKLDEGATIYVYGNSLLTSHFLLNTFSHLGSVLNVFVDVDKGQGRGGSITFEKSELAEKAISDFHKATVEGIKLQCFKEPGEKVVWDTSNEPWSSIAASHSQKGSHKDKRDLVQYTEEDLF